MRPEFAISPRNKIDAATLKILHTAPDGSFSVAEMVYDGALRIGCRWNGNINDPEDKGHPRSHGQGTWFMLPDDLGEGLAAMVKTFSPKMFEPA